MLEEDEDSSLVLGRGEGGFMATDMNEMELGDLASEDAVAQLMRTLEGQVSQLDKKLE